MHNIAVDESANHLSDRIGFTNVGQELVAQAFTNRGATNDAGDVDERHRCGQEALAAKDFGQLSESRVGQVHHTDVWLDSCKRIVCRQNVVFGECVEQG